MSGGYVSSEQYNPGCLWPPNVRWVVSERSHGDFCLSRVSSDLLRDRQRALIDLPWTLVNQVHGTDAIDVLVPGEGNFAVADIVATSQIGAVIGIWVGDCVPMLLISPSGRLVMAHIGWRGLAKGAVDRAIRVLEDLHGDPFPRAGIVAVSGPFIGPCCYEFSPLDLDIVAAAIRSEPRLISPPHHRYATVLDMGAAVSHCLRTAGISDLRYAPGPGPVCTGCDQRWFSYRMRGESERHVMAAWRVT